MLLRAQEYSSWSAGLTLKMFNQVLSFVIHTKPNIRKAAQRAIESIIHGSCFMNGNVQTENQSVPEDVQISYHPAGTYLAKFCVEQFKTESLTKSQTVILHVIELLKKTLNGLKNKDIKEICEHLLAILITSKTHVQRNCFDILNNLFATKSPNLSEDLIGKLIAATYEYRPEQNDVNLTLAWLSVMKHGHVCLTSYNATKSLMELKRFIRVCAQDIWKSDNLQIATGVYHTIKELFEVCIASGLTNDAQVNLHRELITKIINLLITCLDEPFGHISQQIVGVFQTIFEICGRHFGDILQPALNQIAARYDDNASKQIQIENAIRAAISTMGPEAALTAVPLTDATGNVNITRLWILQALKKAICGSTFDLFYSKILPLANKCHDQWELHQSEGNLAAARTNELFYFQLWDLFPSFCEQPKDINKFKTNAKTLGYALKNRVEIRPAIFDGLMKLLENSNDDSKKQLSELSKNFLNILINIYIQKPTGSEEHTSHTGAFKLIGEYLKVTPQVTLIELFNSIYLKYKSKERVETVLQKVQEMNRTLDRNETDDSPIGAAEAKRIEDAYNLLKNIIQENEMGVDYVDGNEDEMRELLQTVPVKRLSQLFKRTQQFIEPFVYQAYFELLIPLAVYQSEQTLNELFVKHIEPTLRSAKKGGLTPLIKDRQAKSYELLRNILESENNGCQKFVQENLLQIQKALLNTLQNRKSSSQDVRLA